MPVSVESVTEELSRLKERVKLLLGTGAEWELARDVNERLIEKALRASELDVDCPGLASRLIGCAFFLPYFADDAQRLRLVQNQLGTACARVLCPAALPVPSSTARRNQGASRFRVGLLSNGLRQHPVGWLTKSLIEGLDRERFAIHLYMIGEPRTLDDIQAWFVFHADASWRNASWEKMRKRIAEDELDLLIDLDSATVDLSAMVVAAKPAPKVATWLGWDASGLPSVDFYITDRTCCPAVEASGYREAIKYLPNVFVATEPFKVSRATLTRETLDIPGDAVVFFSGHTSYKRNPANLFDQLSIVAACRRGFLVIKGAHARLRSLILQLAGQAGLPAHRIRWLERDPDELIHRANLQIVDIVLDTFPYNGITTTVEAISAGIPVVTRCGRQLFARSAGSISLAAGLGMLVAYSQEEYIDIGIRIGNDESFREACKQGCRSARVASPIFDSTTFCSEMQDLWESIIRE